MTTPLITTGRYTLRISYMTGRTYWPTENSTYKWLVRNFVPDPEELVLLIF